MKFPFSYFHLSGFRFHPFLTLMPEGPEVRRYAVQLAQVLDGEKLVEVSARTKAAKAWLGEHPGELVGRRVRRVRAHGKNMVGEIEGGFYFYSHLMMWGRWQIEDKAHRVLERVPEDAENGGGESEREEDQSAKSERESARDKSDEAQSDKRNRDERNRDQGNKREKVEADENERERRERACISTAQHRAILLSAPVFEIGQGQPFRDIEYLRSLGPDILPYEDDGVWDEHEFLRRLLSDEKSHDGAREIGAALLDQTVCAGIGNYLRAEILFLCKVNPWTRIADLTSGDLECLNLEIPRVAMLAYANGGATADASQRERMRLESGLTYAPGREYGTRHLAFRRTNLPCLMCGDLIRQKRQVARVLDDEEKSRIIYFCPTCQNVKLEEKPKRAKRAKKQT